jgi:maleylacetoacetate isomerase
VVPTLYDGNAKLFQSVAILEYLEEKHPNPPILPKDLLARAWVRGFALINAADSHPLIVPRIRNYLANVLKVDEAGRTAWIQHWLGSGLHAMEELLAEKNPTDKFCDGDNPTIADICLVTQVTPAQLFNTDVEPFKRVMRIYDACMAIPAFADAHPRKQLDFEGHRSRPANRSAKEKDCLSRTIHAASVAAGYPEDDLFQRSAVNLRLLVLHRRGKDRGATSCRPATRRPADVA